MGSIKNMEYSRTLHNSHIYKYNYASATLISVNVMSIINILIDQRKNISKNIPLACLFTIFIFVLDVLLKYVHPTQSNNFEIRQIIDKGRFAGTLAGSGKGLLLSTWLIEICK